MKKIKINFGDLAFTAVLLSIGFLIGYLLGTKENQILLHFYNLFIPFIVPVLASLLGATAAYWGIRRKQDIDNEHEKIKFINKTIFKLKRSFESAALIKALYYDRVAGTEDKYRSVYIPQIHCYTEEVDTDISDLFFLADKDANDPEFIDLNLIESALLNYNLIIEMVEMRNRVLVENFRNFEKFYIGNGTIEGSVTDLESHIGEAQLDALTHRGESLIFYTDKLLVDIYQAWVQIQSFAGSRIDSNLVPSPRIVKAPIPKNGRYFKMLNNKVPPNPHVIIEN